MMIVSCPHPAPSSSLMKWTQNAAIFAACANLFSTALANFGFVVFLTLFACLCASRQRRYLDTKNFPLGVALAIGLYIGWQAVGLTYTDAPMSYALKNVFTERKIVYLLPLALIFSDGGPKKRFLIAFLLTSVVGMALSFALVSQHAQARTGLNPSAVFRSHATQGMVFAICVALSFWFGLKQQTPRRRWVFFVLAVAFLLNVTTVTQGRSGYLVLLVLIVWAFSIWRGFKGVAIGMVAASLLGMGAFYTLSSVHSRVMEGVNEVRSFSTISYETSLGRRMVQYETTLGMIKENPILGVGTGGYKKHFSAIAETKYTGWRAVPFDDPHNQYLFVASENGLIGLATFLFMLGMILKYCLKGGSIYGKMAAGCLLAWCATSLFSGHFRTFPEGHLIAFIVGILMVNRPSGTMESQPECRAA